MDIPLQSTAPVLGASASQPKQNGEGIDRTIGVCHLIQNPPIPPLTAENSLSPVRSVNIYYKWFEKQQIGLDGEVEVLQSPQHGTLKEEWGGNYRYHPASDYYGADKASLLISIGKLKVKLIYSFKIMPKVPGGTEGYDPYEDKNNCPNGELWKISHSAHDLDLKDVSYTYSLEFMHTSNQSGKYTQYPGIEINY